MKKMLGSYSLLKTNNLIIKTKNIAIIAIFLLLCIFSNSALAREEVPEDLIQAKENAMNEIALGAGNGITLSRTYGYNNGNPSISLSWNAVQGASKYKVYQAKEGEGENLIATVQGTEVNLNKANSGINDTTPPPMPQVKAVSSLEGNSIIITQNEDKGTTYRHRVEEVYDKNSATGDVIFLLDTSNSHSGYHLNLFMSQNSPIISIASEIINKYNFSVATLVMAEKGDNMIIGNFTKDIEEVKNQVRNFEQKNNHFFSIGLKQAIEMLESRNSRSKIIILFTDCDSDYDADFAEERDVDAKKELLTQMRNKGIKLYSIYDSINSYLYMDQYSEAFKGPVDSEKTVEAFNEIFDYVKEDIVQKSNTVSTTVTSGIKGYQYAITTSSSHTFTNEEVVPLDEVPTFVSGEKQMVQYLHIRAVDNAGNPSESQSILLQVPAKITLKSDYEYGMNYVPLSWINNDTRSGYVYRLYRKVEGEGKFTQIASSNSIEQRIYKDEWSTPTKYTTPGTYTYTVPKGITRIKVAVVGGGGRRRNGL